MKIHHISQQSEMLLSHGASLEEKEARMFLDKRKLKSLMKRSYKGTGIHIGNYDKYLYMSGAKWEFYFEKKYVPKEIFAAIYEIAGMIPDLNEQICVDKAGVQYEIETYDKDTFEYAKKERDIDMFESNIVVMTNEAAMRIFQARQGLIMYTENAAAVMINNGCCEQYEEPMDECFALEDRIWWTSMAGYFNYKIYDNILPDLVTDLSKIDLDPNRGVR